MHGLCCINSAELFEKNLNKLNADWSNWHSRGSGALSWLAYVMVTSLKLVLLIIVINIIFT